MKKILMLSLLLITLISCSSKNIENENAKTSSPDSMPTQSPTPTLIPSTVPSKTDQTIDFINNEKTTFWCPNNEYYGVANETIGFGLGLILMNDGTFIVTYDSAGGDYYYGKYEMIEKNIFAYYGEILDYTNLERCPTGEGCFYMPEITDTTIDGYLKLDGTTMYFIPYQISHDELINYSDDKGCQLSKN